MAGLEPTTPCTQNRCDSQLRYISKWEGKTISTSTENEPLIYPHKVKKLSPLYLKVIDFLTHPLKLLIKIQPLIYPPSPHRQYE